MFELASAPPRPIGFHALTLSVGALLIPASGAIFFPDTLVVNEALLWILALVPAFLLSYYRGWKGAAMALALGMAVLALTHATLQAIGRDLPDQPALISVVAIFIVATLGVGWLAERMHKDLAAAEAMALTDSLTGLPNRRQALAFLEREFAVMQRSRQLAIVAFDIDRFKNYNDRHGHAAGDIVLRVVGDTLATLTRRMDMTSRMGGEEFLSILSDSDEVGALAFVARVRAGLAHAEVVGGAITVSCGIACYDCSMSDVRTLLSAADRAMYQAKNAGRDCVRVYEPIRSPEGIGSSSSLTSAAGADHPPPPRPHSRRTASLIRLVARRAEARAADAGVVRFQSHAIQAAIDKGKARKR